jgi:hypothetical protein
MRKSVRLVSGAVIALGIVAGGLRTADAASAFASGEEASAHCPSDTVVWVNTRSHIYHYPGISSHTHSYFGNANAGVYMCADARAEGDRPAKDELRP